MRRAEKLVSILAVTIVDFCNSIGTQRHFAAAQHLVAFGWITDIEK